VSTEQDFEIVRKILWLHHPSGLADIPWAEAALSRIERHIEDLELRVKVCDVRHHGAPRGAEL
jgi:hypothetical protein